ncbi:methyltransferase, FxLD system [Solwaraspora sp. WMMA2065]|uniref:methyltransferase, FxLD system n=1 Tax=Solwaraspora sp. WMMA2065 TaxID=3015166 RepID=UPI00259B2730|nr:methyltransferase, FxLD system [Solwaraspora sp. WMMA2065]WJK37851.1 methyltransferase, FxLD system [Solwaraspora sp. WMMA2065]
MDVVADDSAEVDGLREALVRELLAGGSIASAEVEAAFRVVPRHLFAPEVSSERAYANDIVRTKRDEHGVTISSVSAPWLQAVMLEQAQIGPGMRCLEVGSGGYNAALMAELVGPGGAVTTVDIDADVTGRARRFLDVAGYGRVNVVLADAEHGVPARAPFDRIIVTVGVWDVPPAWSEQLSDGGRLVVPLRLRGLSRSVALVRDGDRLVSVGHEMAGFVGVQGAGAHTERLVTLHGDEVGLRFDDDVPVDVEALRAAVRQPRTQVWSGVTFGGTESFDGLFLWLATCVDRFCLLSRARTDAARALVDPASPIATPTVLGDAGFAYVTFREVEGRGDVYEFGAYAHGAQAESLAATLIEQIRVWDRDHRHGGPARISVVPGAVVVEEAPGARVIPKRHTTITISWP